MKHWFAVCAVFALMLGGLVVTAVAEDLQPPWWRGQISTTSQIWEFINPQPNPIKPDGPAPGGQPPLPSTQLVVTPGPSPWDHWLEMDHPYEYKPNDWVGYGVWPLSGRMDVTVDNHNPPNEVKLVQVQLTWRPQDVGEVPIFENLYPAPVKPPVLVQEILLGPEWRESTYAWEIRPNPEYERFTISGTINVDELVVDTWCIPEPSTFMLLGMGAIGLGAYAWRRRKK